MTSTRPAATVTVSSVLDRFRRRWLTILAITTACLTVALGVHALLPQRYTSTATLTVAPLTDTPYGSAQPAQLVNMESERATVTSLTVATAASRALPSHPDPRDIVAALDVVIPPQSLVLRISATTPDRDRSAEWANAVAQAYLNDRGETARDGSAKVAARWQADIDARLRARPTLGAAAKAMVDREIAMLRGRQNDLSAVGVLPGRLVSTALPATNPSSRSIRVVVAAGLAVGLFVGAGVALLAHRWDRRIGSATWIQETFGIPARGTTSDPAQRQARQVLGVACAKRRSDSGPARVAVVSSARVTPPYLGELVVAAAQEAGIDVQLEQPGSASSSRSGLSGTGDQVAVTVCQQQAVTQQPWPVPVITPETVVAVEVSPLDARRDLSDLLEAVWSVGAGEVHTVVVREERDRAQRGPAAAATHGVVEGGKPA